MPPALEIAEADQKAEIIEIYARLKQIQKAENLLAEFEPSAFIDTPIYHNKRFILFPLINANLALGKPDHALELWQIYGEKDDTYGIIRLTNSLIEFGYQDKANFYLSTMQSNSEMLRDDGANIVKNYLKLENTEEALKIAENMSEENDNYQQQQALKYVAEKLIADNKKELALKVLEFAFQRAKKVIFEHESMQSVGASSGTRKVIYLNNIYQLLMRIKQFKKAYAVINAIGSDHWIAKQFIMESLADFAKQQAEMMPRKEINKILSQIQNTMSDSADDYYPTRSKLLIAEIYARTGEKIKAVELLTKVLEEGKESCCYENNFLLSAGKVFEQNNLKADTKMKKILRVYIDED